MTQYKAIALLLVLLSSLLALAHTEPVQARPRIHFYPLHATFNLTTEDGALWQGRVNGDLRGAVSGQLRTLTYQPRSWQVEFEWTLAASDPDYSFTTNLKGAIHPQTGQFSLIGTVKDGRLAGALVSVEGKVTDLRMLDLKGTIYLTPVLALGEIDGTSRG
jgi:hypothetical protein